MAHPVDEMRGIKSDQLLGKVIVLGVTGSIAAGESIKLSHELIRYGATVIPVMTPHAQNILHNYALSCATGQKVITTLTGDIEHVKFCGDVQEKADILLIAPCTSNTLAKIALGIDDTPVTTFATTAIGGGIPILIVPAMHSTMYHHPKIQGHIASLKKMGIKLITPSLAEGKAKMISRGEIVSNTLRLVGGQFLKNKKILIIGGATMEAIDDVRVLTNLSSGKMAIALAQTAFELGATTTLWYGYGAGCTQHPPSFLDVTFFKTCDDLLSLIASSARFDIIINCAAISDYKPVKKQGKIPSGQRLTLNFVPTPIINEKLRAKTSILVGFKLEVSQKNIIKKAYGRLTEHKLDYIVANTLDTFAQDTMTMWLIKHDKKVIKEMGTKGEIAKMIFHNIYV
jgi:phosphopantothenoylcysteine decarboxylase/phosphopantothenate--cysteine ligase